VSEAAQEHAAPSNGVDIALSVEQLDACLRLVEALVFASVEPVRESSIRALLVGQALIAEDAPLAPVMEAFVARYETFGVEPVPVAGGWQFRTRPDLAQALTRVIERPRRLGRSAMETLAVIAYHQPCTRTDIESIRGVALSQNVLDALLEDSLIVPRGRKEVPGRPVLWGTGTGFLQQFGLQDLSQLPRREELLLDVPNVAPAPLLDTQAGSASDDAAADVVPANDVP